MKTFRLLAATAIALTAVPVLAATTSGISAQRLSDVDKYISSNDFEGRGPATRAETKTINYIADQMRQIGLKPGGDTVNGQRSWFQNVPLLKSDLAADPVVTIQGPGGSMSLTQGNEIAVKAPLNGANQISIINAPIVFAGYGVSAPERNWDDFKGEDVRGKIIVVLINDPDFEGGEGDFGGKAMTYYGRWTYKYEEAARRGAAGVLIVHETDPASYGWNTVKEFQHQHPVRHRPPEPGGIAHAVRNLDPARRRGPAVQECRARFRAGEGRGEDQGIPADRPQVDAERHRQRQCRDDHVAQRRRLSPRQKIPGRDRHLLGALGSPRHRQARRARRQDL